jgi:hypothetical protein
MYGWTEFDMVRIEQKLKEASLQRTAMMPKRTPRRPIRTALSWTLLALARHLSPEQVAIPAPKNLVIGAEN